MKHFVFPLARIRAWNLARRQIEEAALEAIIDRQRRSEDAYSLICLQRAEFEQRTLRRQLIESSELARVEQFRVYATAEGHRLQKAQAEFAVQIAERRARIVEISRKIELLDRLRQRQQAAWTAAETKELQSAADEAFLQQLIAKRG